MHSLQRRGGAWGGGSSFESFREDGARHCEPPHHCLSLPHTSHFTWTYNLPPLSCKKVLATDGRCTWRKGFNHPLMADFFPVFPVTPSLPGRLLRDTKPDMSLPGNSSLTLLWIPRRPLRLSPGNILRIPWKLAADMKTHCVAGQVKHVAGTLGNTLWGSSTCIVGIPGTRHHRAAFKRAAELRGNSVGLSYWNLRTKTT